MAKLKHLPTFAIVAIGVGVLALLTGTTYAVVKTMEHFNNIQMNEAGTNEFGRQQLNVTFNGCSESKEGATYELKRGGNLSAEDGVKTLQARCDMAAIETWFMTNVPSDYYGPPPVYGRADTVTAIDDISITLARGGLKEAGAGSKFIVDGKEATRADIKVGDVVFAQSSTTLSPDGDAVTVPYYIFTLSQAPKYYDTDLQSYVNERGPCPGNATRTCLKPSNINHTVLIIAHGAGSNDPRLGTSGFKQVQGRVMEYTATSITLDVGGGTHYTLATNSNIIDYYNQNTVSKLAGIDAIYANTDAEQLIIKKGDSLEITYIGDENDTSSSIAWSDAITIQLMVERIPGSLDVLQKY